MRNKISVIAALLILINSCNDNPIDNNPPCGGIQLGIVPAPPYDSPIWHPSGEFIGFNHTTLKSIEYPRGKECWGVQNFAGDAGFWIINPDGTNMRRIFPYKLQAPAWSPDGEWIAFNIPIGNEVHIFKMKFTGNGFDTTSLIQLTTEGRNFLPAWSPDGQWIAYDRTIPVDSNGIWIISPKGGTKIKVADGRFPDWHPDGHHIIFIGFHQEIYRLNLNDSTIMRLTSLNQQDIYATLNYSPQYSHDGTEIAFYSQPRVGPPAIWKMNYDGSSKQKVSPDYAWRFDWSPDGRKFVFLYLNYDDRTHSGNGQLWLINTDGSGLTQLTHFSR